MINSLLEKYNISRSRFDATLKENESNGTLGNSSKMIAFLQLYIERLLEKKYGIPSLVIRSYILPYCVSPPPVVSSDVRCVQASSTETQFSSGRELDSLESVMTNSTDTWWISGRESVPYGYNGNEWLRFELSSPQDDEGYYDTNGGREPDEEREENDDNCDNYFFETMIQEEISLVTQRSRVVRSVSIKIPPMPQGPLSVRDFYVEYLVIRYKDDEDKPSRGRQRRTRRNGRQQFTNRQHEWRRVDDDRIFTTNDISTLQTFHFHKPVVAEEIRLVFTRNAISAAISEEVSGVNIADIPNQAAELLIPRPYWCVGLFQVVIE